MKKQKLYEIEYLRAFAFLAVVLQHAIGHYAYKPETTLADGVLLGGLLMTSKFAVPMFLFITGLVLFYNDRGAVPYGTFLSKRAKDILLPYLAWSLIYTWIGTGSQSITWTYLKQAGLDFVTGKGSYHLWYIVMIFPFYMTFPLWRKLILWINTRGSTVLWIAGSLVGFGLLYLWLTEHGSLFESAARELSVPVLTPWFTEYIDRNPIFFFYYFVLGAFTGLYAQQLLRTLMEWKLLVLTVYTAAIGIMWYRIISHFTITPQLTIHYNDTFLVNAPMAVFLTMSLPAMLIIGGLVTKHASRLWQRVLSSIGSYSYIGYLAHALTLVWSTQLTALLLPYATVTVKTIAAFLLCSLFSVGLAMLLRRVYTVVARRQQKTG
jgi:peptidoglycan/LPS O-acetylase OafA/YrhL